MSLQVPTFNLPYATPKPSTNPLRGILKERGFFSKGPQTAWQKQGPSKCTHRKGITKGGHLPEAFYTWYSIYNLEQQPYPKSPTTYMLHT